MQHRNELRVQTRPGGSPSAPRLLFTLFLLLAFGLQSYLAQAHFHPPAAASTSAPTAPDKPPVKDDPANCPICLGIVHAGSFITPGAAPLLLPSAIVFAFEIAPVLHKTSPAPSHSWQSRAPPSN